MMKAEYEKEVNLDEDECVLILSIYLLLEGKYVGNTAVDRVSEPSLSLVAYSDHRIESFVDGDMAKQLGNIAGSEHLVHGRKVGCSLLRIKIRCKYASHHTLSP